MTEKPHAERLRRNDESRNKASHHREEWSADEIDFLMQWDPGEGNDDLAIIAECLGRTIEACRQRFYEMKRGEVLHVTMSKTTTVSVTETTTARYIGTNDDPDDQWWTSDYYTKEK